MSYELMWQNLLWALAISLIVALVALWRGSLSRSGAAAALLVGTLTFGLGGWQWGVLLGIFFVTSSFLSHFKESEKKVAAEKFDKGHKRDAWQALANGGVGALVALLSFLLPAPFWFPFFVGVMGTVNADTWATELGTLGKNPPRLITNGKTVAVGTSGAISILGTAAALAGGGLVGIAAGLLTPELGIVPALLLGSMGGLIGSLVDSWLGATVQRIYYCDQCQKDTEKQLHKCGTPTRPLRGWFWLNNDWVNLLSSIAGGLVAVALSQLFIK